MKLVVMVVDANDVDRVSDELVRSGHPVTKLGSSGGLLRRHSTTLISGVEDEAVEEVIAIARRLTQARTDWAPVHSLPFLGEGTVSEEMLEVRRGGAVLWVLPVERFERL